MEGYTVHTAEDGAKGLAAVEEHPGELDAGAGAWTAARLGTGFPVGTLAIGKPGAVNAALFAVAILANSRPELRQQLKQFRAKQEEQVRAATLD